MQEDFLNNLFDLSNKVVWVTGATGQLGKEICRSFDQADARVYGTDKVINPERLIHSEGITYIKSDITDKASVAETCERIYYDCGRIDVLINNAGVSCFEPFEERPEESFDWVMDVNLKGTFFCIQAYVNKTRKHKATGSVVNVASMYGLISPDERIYTDYQNKNSEVYGATKAGIIQMTRYFAAHLAKDGIRVNCVSPGGIYNPFSPQGDDFIKNYAFRCPMGRMAEVEEMIGGIMYLSSSAAKYTTGHNLVIDGGMSCW